MLENSIPKGEFIKDEAVHLYYLSLIMINYFKEDSKNLEKLIDLISIKLETENSISSIWYLVRALLLLKEHYSDLKITANAYSNIYSIIKFLSQYKNNLFFDQMVYWFDLDKILNLGILTTDFYKKIVNELINKDGGFRQTSTSTSYSLRSTFLILSITKKYFSEEKELLNLVEENSKKNIENVNKNFLEDLVSIEDFYNYFVLKKMLEQ